MTDKQMREATREVLAVLACWEIGHDEAIEITRRANMAAWEVANPDSPHSWTELDDLVDVACQPIVLRDTFSREDTFTSTVEGAAAFERHRAIDAGELADAQQDARDAARDRDEPVEDELDRENYMDDDR